MPRPLAEKPVSEELAQLRNTRQMLFFMARTVDRRDADLAEQLARVDRKLDQVADLVEQYVKGIEHCWLESHGSVVQTNEVIHHLCEDVRKAPALTANATALAVGTVLRPRPPLRIPRYRPRAFAGRLRLVEDIAA
jgi:hypothetical protein